MRRLAPTCTYVCYSRRTYQVIRAAGGPEGTPRPHRRREPIGRGRRPLSAAQGHVTADVARSVHAASPSPRSRAPAAPPDSRIRVRNRETSSPHTTEAESGTATSRCAPPADEGGNAPGTQQQQ